jgi:hypothetical protein
MASQVSPGVVIRESDLSNAVVVGAQAIRAAFASSFRTGPVGKITNINSERELIDTFGTPAEANAADWLVASEFLRYGGQLAVVRADTGVKNATLTGTGVLIADKDSFDSGVTSEKFAARYAGSDGNNLRVVIVDHGADQVLTFDKEPDQTPVIGSTITFQSGKTVEVYDYNSITRKVTVVGQSIAVGDTVAEEDPIATFTHDGVTEAGRTPGTYTPAAHAGGASFQVVVADAGAGVGGAVTVTMLTAGDGYEIGDTITLAGAATGGGSDITITVATIVDPNTAVSAAVAWDYNSQIIGTTGLTYRAIGPRPGTSAWAAERYLSYDEVHILVVDETTNTIVERFTYLSKLTDAKSPEGNSTYWKSYVNEYSRYIYAGIDLSSAEVTATGENPGGTAASYNATAAVPKTLARILYTAGGSLSGGSDDYSYTAGEIQAAYDEFLDTETTEIDFVLMGGDGANEEDTIAKAQAVVTIANTRKDCIAFISPWSGTQIATSGGAALSPAEQLSRTIEFFGNIPSSSYVILDSGVKYTYDRFNDKYRYIGCNGDVAGVCVSTSASLDDWFSPAGLNRGGIQNVVKLAFNPNKAQRDDLYTNRINPIVSLPGSGPVLFGDKTALASPSAFDRINVRRLFLNVEKRARALAESVLFEQNDTTTRSGFASSIGSYLSEIQARRGVIDYLVVCDESNNTPEVIDRNEFVAELYLKPTRSINYVTVTVTATRTGVSFAEVVGR